MASLKTTALVTFSSLILGTPVALAQTAITPNEISCASCGDMADENINVIQDADVGAIAVGGNSISVDGGEQIVGPYLPMEYALEVLNQYPDYMDELMNKAIVELELDNDAYEYFMRNAAFEILTGQYDPNEKESMDLEEADSPCTNVCGGIPNNDQTTQIVGDVSAQDVSTDNRASIKSVTRKKKSGPRR